MTTKKTVPQPTRTTWHEGLEAAINMAAWYAKGDATLFALYMQWLAADNLGDAIKVALSDHDMRAMYETGLRDAVLAVADAIDGRQEPPLPGDDEPTNTVDVLAAFAANPNQVRDSV
jgi:hypothetical protein